MEEKEQNQNLQQEENVTESTDTVEVTEEEVIQADLVEDEKPDFEAQLAEAKASELRLRADFENFKRRNRVEAENRAKYSSQAIVEKLLPLVDNLDRALQIETENDETKSVLAGVEMVKRQLVETLQNEGVVAIPAVGEAFDPNLHQAVVQEASEEHESGIVTAEFQKGYKLHDRVIRPSMVKVAE
ncbi:nucleotide exchange factor GrpE [Exiguobacterium acetylicum]|uniref:nucleotide exchange factor GrpE n=1 Tax=Exiguobacterium acetylicum TaxID=41170 RepID=UPI001EE1F750|nr:nucleotide exchange factor GrpE [Exiguobacterium acetylicum]UKS56842.1 nucleotide exchange factor GrpE [Exiguobacterium acetylicum]